MSSFKAIDLFGSGPHGFLVHGRSLRHATHEPVGADGVHLAAQGRSGRRIEQTGTLVADDIAPLQSQVDAIESAMDGVAGQLVDDRGRIHADVLMIRFQPGAIRRIGTRVGLDYRIEYIQAQP